MVSINPENIKNVVQSAENGLKKKALGGFTPESTKEALQKVADGVKQLADNAIGAVQRELQAYKGKSAQEMAELTSKKDAVILNKDKQIAEVKENAKQQIKAAKAVKTGKPKTLPNGNVETVKVNKNGARMTTETTPDGRKVNVSVETINGDIRKTKYDPVSGKPVKTFTNINGDKVIDYAEGNSKITSVNVKKIKPQKPKLVSDKVIESKYGMQKIEKVYSDGSYEMVGYNPRLQLAVSSEKFNAAGKKIETFALTSDKDGNQFKTIKKLNPETGKKIEELVEKSNGCKTKTFYNDSEIPYKKVEITQQGLKRIIAGKPDKYGNINVNNPSMKYVYPKNSPIKESKIDFQSQFYARKESLKMKDGSTVTMEINDNYDAYNVTIMRKGEEPKVLDRQAGQEYLEKIGKVGYREDNQYYYNHLGY